MKFDQPKITKYARILVAIARQPDTNGYEYKERMRKLKEIAEQKAALRFSEDEARDYSDK